MSARDILVEEAPLLQERTIEAQERSEEAVVSKEARVKEKISINRPPRSAPGPSGCRARQAPRLTAIVVERLHCGIDADRGGSAGCAVVGGAAGLLRGPERADPED